MCGLFGWVLSDKAMAEGDVKLLAAFLGTEMDERGGDSWGVALPYKAELYKGLGKFEQSKVLTKLIEPAVLGHTQKATTGKIVPENAHPFIIGDTVGAHNGIIHNDRELNHKYKRNFAVDSMHLIAHINEGLHTSEISGYGAVTYYNKKKTSNIFIAKGSSGEMQIVGIGEHKKPRGLIWCSTSYGITKALRMAGFEEYFFYNVRPETLYKVQDHVLLIERPFPFGYVSKPITTYPANTCGYVGRTAGDYLKEKKDQVVGIAGQILNSGQTKTSSEAGKPGATDKGAEADKAIASMPNYDYSSSRVVSLPEDVKKTSEVLPSGDTKAKEGPTRIIACYGCSVLGNACGFYAEDPDGIVFDYQIGHPFCRTCHEFWGLNNGDSVDWDVMNQALDNLRPKLSIVRKDDDGTRRHIGYL